MECAISSIIVYVLHPMHVYNKPGGILAVSSTRRKGSRPIIKLWRLKPRLPVQTSAPQRLRKRAPCRRRRRTRRRPRRLPLTRRKPGRSGLSPSSSSRCDLPDTHLSPLPLPLPIDTAAPPPLPMAPITGLFFGDTLFSPRRGTGDATECCNCLCLLSSYFSSAFDLMASWPKTLGSCPQNSQI
jgi:hypothetical protein